ncbi:MAG: Rha family transcriptional regulator [Pyrinomonadaceae bacterium]|nr:Rha family transcriptional regulator [Pyrinomonadaceae bacterium]
MSVNPKLTVKNGNVYATSIDIAKYFQRGHREVLRAIRNILQHLSEEFLRLNFQPVYGAKLHHKRTEIYQLTKDGFAMIALGFTGEKAIKFREAYITAFNEMEAKLRAREFHTAQDRQLKLFPEFNRAVSESRPAMPLRFAYEQTVRRGIPAPVPKTLRRMVAAGEIEGYKASGVWLVYQDSFAAFLKNRRV